MPDTNQPTHLLLGLDAEETQKLHAMLTGMIEHLYPWMTHEQRESLYMLARADQCVSIFHVIATPESQLMLESCGKFMLDLVARWARKGAMTDAQWREVKEGLPLIQAEVTQHYVRRLTQQVN